MSAKKTKKQKNTPGTELWIEAAEVPRAGVPDAITLEKRRKRMRLLVLSWPVVVPFVIGAMVVSNAAQDNQNIAAAIATTDGRATAERALLDWIASDPAPLPGAQLLSWDGIETITVPELTEATAVNSIEYKMEVNKFTLVTPDGQFFEAGVQVATNPQLGAIVMGNPSLTPVAPAAMLSDWTGVVAWPGYESASVPQPVTDAVNAWATAFTGTDPAQLRLATGDQNGTHFYMPLVGIHSVTATVGEAAALSEVTDTTVPAQRMVVRVSLSMVWRSQVVSGDNEQPQPTEITYDVVVSGADAASPRVVAWGAPGTGPSLADFSNAVEGRAIDVEGLKTLLERQDVVIENEPAVEPEKDVNTPVSTDSEQISSDSTAGGE